MNRAACKTFLENREVRKEVEERVLKARYEKYLRKCDAKKSGAGAKKSGAKKEAKKKER